MTTKEKLIQEIEKTPDILLDNLLDFLLFVRNRYEDKKISEDNEISIEEQEIIIASKQAFTSGDYLTLDEYLVGQV
ncbi:DUF2281 domain-containing protein [Phormidium tenue]|jgi:hypothetical protein|uniref:DUF2281 domain-containing protein n=1 Tax=Phormidium tenue FACHB-1050 TaxID=2692857 RepID=A0ABR8CEF0_9CYAN|nr:DUF2281 domain-containing protein [Phormidium tenue]MBD2319104.1 DUF2281 domain-containing protein [Phormidium tenue FACHB-1050]